MLPHVSLYPPPRMIHKNIVSYSIHMLMRITSERSECDRSGGAEPLEDICTPVPSSRALDGGLVIQFPNPYLDIYSFCLSKETNKRTLL